VVKQLPTFLFGQSIPSPDIN